MVETSEMKQMKKEKKREKEKRTSNMALSLIAIKSWPIENFVCTTHRYGID